MSAASPSVLFLLNGGGGGFVDAFKENPLFLSINVFTLACCLAIIVERAIYQMRNFNVKPKEFFLQVKKLVVAGNVDRAIKLCEAGPQPLLKLVKSGLTQASKGAEEIDASMSEAIGEIKPPIEARIGALWSMANIATLVGLLGTVYGLIHTFGAVANPNLSPAEKQATLANGIAEAMYNTALGLFIAIMCMLAHMFLHGRAKTIMHDLDSTQEGLFNLLTIETKDR